jgi:hypothetical protein
VSDRIPISLAQFTGAGAGNGGEGRDKILIDYTPQEPAEDLYLTIGRIEDILLILSN